VKLTLRRQSLFGRLFIYFGLNKAGGLHTCRNGEVHDGPIAVQREVRAAQRALKPYHLALGRVAHEWNHMQEQLGLLFCAVSGLNRSMGMGIWHVLRSDRTQRDLLKAANIAAERSLERQHYFPKAKDDIEWILAKVNALAEGRNSTIHAPAQHLWGRTNTVRHSRKFAGREVARKDLVAEFERQEGSARAIRLLAAEIRYVLASHMPGYPDKPWPSRPVLPTLKQKSSRQGRNRRRKTK
jgi:hypothetical protein